MKTFILRNGLNLDNVKRGIYNELKSLLSHFIWNWEDYLEKNKLSF